MFQKPRSLRAKIIYVFAFLAIAASAASILRASNTRAQHDFLRQDPDTYFTNLEQAHHETHDSQHYTTHRQIRVNGTQWAMTYVPFTASGECKTSKEIARDANKIADVGFTSIRLYSTDCDVLESIAPALRSRHLGLVVGIHVGDDFPQGAADQLGDLVAFGAWDVVEMVLLGNEVLWSGLLSASVMADFLYSARKLLHSVGYDGPITTVEPLQTWDSFGKVLCPVVDVIGANIQPYFDGSVEAKDAGKYVSDQLRRLETICEGSSKPSFNLETGWPSQGTSNWRATANAEEQAKAIKSIRITSGVRSAFHGFQDDLWKEDDELEVERYFGCLDAFS